MTTFAAADLQPGVLTIAQAAVRLGIRPSTAYDIIKRGQFPVRVLQIGGRKKISIPELDAYLAERKAS